MTRAISPVSYTHLGKKILVTAGPTREALDPVRFLTNHSTGKMGYAIARVAAARGAEVTLVTGPTEIKKPGFVKVVPIESAREMYEAVIAASEEQDAIIKAAAVACLLYTSTDPVLRSMADDHGRIAVVAVPQRLFHGYRRGESVL